MSIRFVTTPRHSLLEPYAQRNDTYVDCYRTEVLMPVTLSRFVQAFMTTPLFRAERVVLRLAGRPSEDGEVAALAQGLSDSFAAWTVEGRSETELLLCDVSGRTRSLYRVEREGQGAALVFGSAVVPPAPGGDLGLTFRMLLPFHKVYARRLLAGARASLARSGG